MGCFQVYKSYMLIFFSFLFIGSLLLYTIFHAHLSVYNNKWNSPNDSLQQDFLDYYFIFRGSLHYSKV